MRHRRAPTKSLRLALCLATIALGLVALVGWVWHVDAFKVVLPGLTTMKANTAIAFVAGGSGLLLASVPRATPGRRAAIILMGAVVALLGAASLVEYAFGVRLGLDELLFADPNSTSMPYPGRMSPATAVGFLPTGVAIVLLAGRGGRWVGAAHALAAAPAAIGYLSLAGYAYGVNGLYSFGPFVSVAIHTALAFACLAAAILLTRPGEGWARGYRRRPLSRAVLLRLLGLSLTVPFVSGLFVVGGARLGFYEPLFGPALFAAASAAAIAWLALRAAATVRAAEGEMLNANGALARLNADLERAVAERTREHALTWRVSPDLLCIINLDGSFENANPAWEAALGWSPAALRGMAFADILHPDDVPRSLDAFASVKRGEPVLKFENRYRTATGAYRWLSWVAMPEGGKAYCSARDVSEEKERARLLAERTADRDRLWATSEDLLVHADYDGAILRTSPSWTRLLGHREAELEAASYLDLLHPDDAAPVAEMLGELRRARQPARVTARVRHADGGWRTIAWSLVPEAGRDRFDAVGRDVTAEHEAEASRVALEEQLRQSQKMEAVGQLTGGVAHDFNNLLTVIRSSTDLLKRPNLREDRRVRYVDAISDTVDRAAKLTGQLLAFARRQSLTPSVFDAGSSVRAIGEMMGTLTGSRVATIMRLPERPCLLNADPSQFDTALVNMAVNARDAMGGEGRLTIGVEVVDAMPAIRAHPAVPGAFVAVSIADTGCGIAADRLDRIFEPFYTTKDVGQGTGLGLSQVFGFAKQSGGEIRVESAVGRGTTFTLYLPHVTRAVEPAAADDEPEPLMDGHGTRVLIVEDNVAVGTFTTQALVELGYRTVWAAGAVDALAELALAELAADGPRFDIVFSDVVMPGMNGIDLAQEVRRRHADLPVVLTSGYSHVLAQNGTCGFELLRKPYSIEQLSRVLSKAATWQRRQRLMAG